MAIWVPAAELCAMCNHPVSMHPDMTGDTSWMALQRMIAGTQ